MSFKTFAATLATAIVFAAPDAFAQSFGTVVAAGTREIMVGDPINQTAPGQVHVYRSHNGKWERSGSITLANSHPMDRFGRSLSIVGDRMLIGATTPDDSARGAGYIYERNRQGTWQQTAVLVPATADSGNAFGRFVHLEGNDAYVVSWGANQGRGVIALFRRGRDGTWTEAGTVTASDAAPGMFFGTTIAIDGNRMAVGAAQRDTARGGVYLFRRERAGEPWVEQSHFRPDSLDQFAGFGSGVVFQGTELLVSAPGVDSARGAVFVYTQDGAGRWSLKGRVVPSSLTAQSQFGAPLAVVGNEVWVGAPGALETRGAVYRMRRAAEGWSEVGRLEPRDAERGDFFGGALAVNGARGIVGLPNDDFGAGTAAVITRRGNEWSVGDKVWIDTKGLEAMVGSRRNCADGKVGDFDCQDVSLLAFLPIKDIGGKRGVGLNDIWGWTDPQTGREYALVGRIDGTSFVDVTEPSHPRYLGDLPKTTTSLASTWRDIKVYKDHAFIVADNAQAHGMQVFDLTRLRSVGNTPETFTPETTYDRIHSAHNIVIDTASGYAFAVGSSSGGETCGGALHMIDIRDPKHPTFAGCFADTETGNQKTGYTHDSQCVIYSGPDSTYRGREICLNSSETAVGIADVTDKANPRAISRAGYPNVGYTHQGWMSEDQRYFYVDDEGDEMAGTVEGTRTLIWDISDLDDPVLAGQYISESKAIDHNLYVKGNLMYQSNYTSGLRILDISDPLKPRLVGHFDTTPFDNDETTFAGSWSNYPYFKSGTIVVSSIGEGLFVVAGPVSPAIP